MKKGIKKNGFTLIEILAVIVILGILMLIAIPAVTRSIGESRDNAYISTADKFIESAIGEVTSFEYSVSNEDYTYYIPTKCLDTENDVTESPYGEFVDSYVVVTNNSSKNDYYYTGYDESGHGILLTYRSLLEESIIKTDLRSIDTTVGVGNRQYTYVYSSSCNKTGERKDAQSFISERGKKTDVTTEGQPSTITPTPSTTTTPTPTPTPTSPYDYIPTNGWITITIGDDSSAFNRYGIVFSIYQLGFGVYGDWTMNSHFESARTTKNNDNSYNFSLTADQIRQRISSYNIRPIYQRTTNFVGTVEFQNLQHGIYFVDMVAGPNALSVPGMIIFVPDKAGNSHIYLAPNISYTP